MSLFFDACAPLSFSADVLPFVTKTWFAAICFVGLSLTKSAEIREKQKKVFISKDEDLLQLAVWTGLEPATPCVTGMYSNQLNYQTSILKTF